MAWGRSRSEHAGPKRGKGFWGRKAVAKAISRRARRRDDRALVDAGRREGTR
jgi:non-ribosomal peptide synthetase component E (peptide arylation enzyme)